MISSEKPREQFLSNSEESMINSENLENSS